MKGLKIFAGFLAILAIIYGAGYYYTSTNVLPNTKLYGHEVSSINKENVKQLMSEQTITLKVRDERQTIDIPLSELDFSIKNIDTLTQDIVAAQKPLKWPLALINGQDFELVKLDVSEDSFNNAIKHFDVLVNTGL
ncbi:MAG: hypothetical protein LBV67_02150, partial [Streptococcaceae bacterium]|nr:hypothetical protein [Streptococcaceae bacterium]